MSAGVPRWRGLPRGELEAAALALLVAMAAGSALMIIAGASPWTVWRTLLARSFGDGYAIGSVLFRATPLVLLGLAVAVPRAAGLFNIGGEGQLMVGALAAAVFAAALPPSTPAALALPLALMVAMAGGATVGAATGALRAYRNAHEVIVAIALNALLAGVVLWLGNRWLFVGETTRTATVVAGARLPELGLAASSASASLVVALAAAAAVAWLLARTTTGLAWRMTGAGPDAAAAAGVDVRRAQVTAMATAGALAGLAGAHFVLGYKHAYEEGLGRGQGFLGVAVALLAGGRPLGVVVSALVFAVLAHGGLAVGELVPKELVDVLQAVVVLVAAATAGRWGRR